MDIVLLKVACKNLIYFKDGKFEVDFIAEKKVLGYEIEQKSVSHLFGNIYKLNTVAFAGINASGKTTSLNIISAILEMFVDNASLRQDMKLSQYFEDFMEIETCFFHKSQGVIYMLKSEIAKDKKTGALYFKDEVLFKKNFTTKANKTNIYLFKESHLFSARSKIVNEFLKNEDSIFSGILNKNGVQTKRVFDMCDTTNHNRLSSLTASLIMPFVNYLDASIESFAFEKKNGDKVPRFKLKFKGSKKLINVDLTDLDEYLSSGTIKGISCLSNMAVAFARGGYLLIDEIENHLNKSIVTSLIHMFASKANKNGATLIFTTHYSEILDTVDRGDSIYISSKADKMQINKFSSLIVTKKQEGMKRSDLILSGQLNSAPSYAAYKALKDELFKELWGGD